MPPPPPPPLLATCRLSSALSISISKLREGTTAYLMGGAAWRQWLEEAVGHLWLFFLLQIVRHQVKGWKKSRNYFGSMSVLKNSATTRYQLVVLQLPWMCLPPSGSAIVVVQDTILIIGHVQSSPGFTDGCPFPLQWKFMPQVHAINLITRQTDIRAGGRFMITVQWTLTNPGPEPVRISD